MEIYIYGLVDPQTEKIRYVGKTQRNLRVRLRAHINDKPKHNTYKFNWINKLKQLNLEPDIVLLETCSQENWVERERFWISCFNDLTNLTTGGDDDNNFFTQLVLDKISNKVKRAWESEDYKKRISEERKKYWSNLDNRKNQSEKLKNKPITEEHKKKIQLSKTNNKPISVNGITYYGIKDCVRILSLHRGTLKRRLLSNKFPEYFYISGE